MRVWSGLEEGPRGHGTARCRYAGAAHPDQVRRSKPLDMGRKKETRMDSQTLMRIQAEPTIEGMLDAWVSEALTGADVYSKEDRRRRGALILLIGAAAKKMMDSHDDGGVSDIEAA